MPAYLELTLNFIRLLEQNLFAPAVNTGVSGSPLKFLLTPLARTRKFALLCSKRRLMNMRRESFILLASGRGEDASGFYCSQSSLEIESRMRNRDVSSIIAR
jgi:hypothetical protein